MVVIIAAREVSHHGFAPDRGEPGHYYCRQPGRKAQDHFPNCGDFLYLGHYLRQGYRRRLPGQLGKFYRPYGRLGPMAQRFRGLWTLLADVLRDLHVGLVGRRLFCPKP